MDLELHHDESQLKQHIPTGRTVEIIIRLDPSGTSVRGLVNGRQMVRKDYTAAEYKAADPNDWVFVGVDALMNAFEL